MYPTPHVVTIVTATPGGFDAYGNPVTTEAHVVWPVYGWGPGGSQELTGWSSQVSADVAVYGPQPPVPITSGTRLEVDGLTYDVEGVVEDYDHGPFGFAPGVRVNLRKVAG